MTAPAWFSMEHAASIGNVQRLRNAYEHGRVTQTDSRWRWRCDSVMDRAIGHGHVSCIDFMRQEGVAWTRNSMTIAALSGNVEVMRYLHENGARWDHVTTAWAVRGNHLDCLRYAHEHGAPWYPRLTSLAAKGHLECLVYLHEHGVPWDEFTMNCAFEGHVECMRYAHEHGCPWNVSAELGNFSHGPLNLSCVKFAYENGAGCTEHTSTLAAQYDQSDCLQFMIERGCRFRAGDRCVQRYREVIAAALSRMRSAVTIQRAWRAAREATQRKAVGIIEDAYMTWSCRPGAGQWYKRSLESFATRLR